MENFLYLILGAVIFLGPVFFFVFYSHTLFGYSKLLGLLYIVGLATGFLVWAPLLMITLVITWGVIIISWLVLLGQIVFYRGD